MHVLIGTKKGPSYTKIDKLQQSRKGIDVVYIGISESKSHVVQANTPGEDFDKIHSLRLTQLSDIPYYHASSGESQHMVIDNKKSTAVDSIGKVITNNKDDVAWMAQKSESAFVGLNETIGNAFEKVNGIQFNPNQNLWYDGIREDKKYRYVDGMELGPFNIISSPKFTKESKKMVFAGRFGNETTDKISFTDTIYKEKAVIKQFTYSMENASAGQGVLKGKSMPSLFSMSGGDGTYYSSIQNETTHIGLNEESWGPFKEVKFLKQWPKKQKIVYGSLQGEQWAVNENGTAHASVDSLSTLGFTKDNLKVLYKAKRTDESLTFVGTEAYQDIRMEMLTPRGNTHTFQGKQEDKWALIVDYNPSSFFDNIERTTFTPDSYGIQAIGKLGDAKKLIRKLHSKSFDYSDGFDSLTSTKYYHYSLPQFTSNRLVIALTEEELIEQSKGEYDGPMWLALEKKNEVNEFESVAISTIDSENVFIAVSSSVSQIRSGYMIEKIDEENNRLVLHGVDNFRRLQQTSRTRIFVPRLHERPYTISARHEGKGGLVHSNNFYTKVESPHTDYYTKNGRFHAIGRGINNDHFIVDHDRSEAYTSIKGAVYSAIPSDESNNRIVILTDNKDRKNPWQDLVLLDDSLESEKLTGAPSISSTNQRRMTFRNHAPNVSWIRLEGKEKSTVIWEGRSHKYFIAVHDQRYDSINDQNITEDMTLKFFLGKRDGLSSIYTNGEHQDWYTQITDLRINEEDESPIYIGHQKYQHKGEHQRRVSDSTTFEDNRTLSRLVHGAKLGPWVDNLHSLHTDSNFENTLYIGVINNSAQLFKGQTPTFESYDDIGWLNVTAAEASETTDNSMTQTIHFLGKKDSKWFEVHNGVDGISVDSILETNLSNEIPESYVRISHGLYPYPMIMADQSGLYFYRASEGSSDIVVHQSKKGLTSLHINDIWLFDNGKLMTFRTQSNDGQQVFAGGELSGLFPKIESPAYQPYSNNVNFIAHNPAPEWLLEAEAITETQWANISSEEELNAMLAEAEVSIPDDTHLKRVSLLHKAQEVSRAWKATPIHDENGVPAFDVMNDGKHSVWVNTDFGPIVDKVITSNGYWGDSVANSRYEAQFDEMQYVASQTLVHGPFESLGEIKKLDLDEEGTWAWLAEYGNLEYLYLNDAIFTTANRIDPDLDSANGQILLQAETTNRSDYLWSQSKYDIVEGYTHNASSAPEESGLFLLHLKQSGLNWFQLDDLISQKSDIIYGLYSSNENGNITLNWLGGELDQTEATMTILPYEISLPQDNPNLEEPRELLPFAAVAQAEGSEQNPIE